MTTLGNVGVVGADGGPGVFQGGGPVDWRRGRHHLTYGWALVATAVGRRPFCSTAAGGRVWNWATSARA